MIKQVFILMLCSFLFACNNSKKEIIFKPIPNKIPENYVAVTDSALEKKQDIVYYNRGKFSGYVYALFAQKDTEFVKSYVNGLEEGTHKKWYRNGILAEERFYINGKKEGIHKALWENGKPQYEFSISNDDYCGEFKEWNTAGTLTKSFHYKNGHEEGSQKLFYDNGKIRSNYIITNGKRVGLLGTKNCVNVSDSILKK